MFNAPSLSQAAPRASDPKRLLVIDDDVELCSLVAEFMRREGIETDLVHDGVAGLAAALEGRYAAIILDVTMPGMGGFEVLRHIREKQRTPVLMLTARGDPVDRVVGLEMGADDYIPKPFDPRELVARIGAVLRRSSGPLAGLTAASDPDVLMHGSLRLDLGAREASHAGRSLGLTPVEFDLVVALVRSAGRVLTRDQLSRIGMDRPWDPADRAIDVHISNLRRKIGAEADSTASIRTVRTAGYMLPRIDPISA